MEHSDTDFQLALIAPNVYIIRVYLNIMFASDRFTGQLQVCQPRLVMEKKHPFCPPSVSGVRSVRRPPATADLPTVFLLGSESGQRALGPAVNRVSGP